MFQNFRIVSYSMIVAFVSVLILPVESKAFISEPDVGKCINGQEDCQNNSSADTAPPISPRGLKVKGESGKTKGKYPADPNIAFPMSEWTPRAKSSAKMKVPEVTRNETPELETQPQSFPMSEWTPRAKSSGNGANKIRQRNEKKK
jgi:hypothetical protein